MVTYNNFSSTVVVRDPLVPLTEKSCKDWMRELFVWVFGELRRIFVQDLWLESRTKFGEEVGDEEEVERRAFCKVENMKRLMIAMISYGSVRKVIRAANVVIPQQVQRSLRDEVQASVAPIPCAPNWINDFRSVLHRGMQLMTKEMDGNKIHLNIIDLA